MKSEILTEIGAKPSISEERGLALLNDSDLLVFSPGISTAGFAEIQMAESNPSRKIIATTIDKKGLEFTNQVIREVGLEDKIETRLEDLTGSWEYPLNYFDFIYARLVLHYLSSQDLDKVLGEFHASLKLSGRLFVVVRSEKSVDRNDPNVRFDPYTKLTFVPYYDKDGKLEGKSTRYFHTPETITQHLEKAGFQIAKIEEYQEQLYKDFMRKEISPIKDHVIEVVAQKPTV